MPRKNAPKRAPVEVEKEFSSSTSAIKAKRWLQDSGEISLGESIEVKLFKKRPKVLILRTDDHSVNPGILREYLNRAASEAA